MTHFEIDQGKREALTPERAEELLAPLDEGVESIKLSGKSFGDGSAAVAAAALQRAIPTLKRLNIADIIASRPEEEAKRTLTAIADALATCKHLIAIDLSDNALGAKGIQAIGELLSGQERLEELLLCNNGLAADAGELITASLLETSPTALVKLHFHNNLLETAGSIALAPVVENSPKLADFRFSSLRLERKGAVRICRALQPRIASTLKRLNLSDNTFMDEGSKALAEALAEAPLLETLLLRDDALGDDGVKMICEVLAGSAPNLAVLDISGNEMATRGASGLATLLRASNLKEVVAEDNELGNPGALNISKGLIASSTIELLDVSCSEIGGRGALALAIAAAKIETLQTIIMNGNSIPGEAVASIEELLEDRLGPLDDNDDDDEDGDEDEEEDEDENGDEDEDEDHDEDEISSRIRNESEAHDKFVKANEKVDNADVDKLTSELGNITL